MRAAKSAGNFHVFIGFDELQYAGDGMPQSGIRTAVNCSHGRGQIITEDDATLWRCTLIGDFWRAISVFVRRVAERSDQLPLGRTSGAKNVAVEYEGTGWLGRPEVAGDVMLGNGQRVLLT